MLLQGGDSFWRDVGVSGVEVLEHRLQELQEGDSLLHSLGILADEEDVNVLEDLVRLLSGHVGDGHIGGLATSSALQRVSWESQRKGGYDAKREDSGTHK